jgi:metal-responsive CopG/Arc/MetJ family transcriptional regulator
MRNSYTNVAIPSELAEEIDKLVHHSKLGHTSRAQFVLEAIRERIIDYNKIDTKSEKKK